MTLIQIDRNPSRRQLNLFGAIWLVFFAIVGGVAFKGSGSVAVAIFLWLVAVAIPSLGWAFPRFMRVVYISMAYLTLPIGLVISFLIMAAVYYLLVTPIGRSMRLFGYDPMNRQLARDATTYWRKRAENDDLERFFRQF